MQETIGQSLIKSFLTFLTHGAIEIEYFSPNNQNFINALTQNKEYVETIGKKRFRDQIQNHLRSVKYVTEDIDKLINLYQNFSAGKINL